MSTYYTHPTNPNVRIKVTSKLVIFERFTLVNTLITRQAVHIVGTRLAEYSEEDAPKEWRYDMRIKLPVNLEHANHLRELYNLPDDVARHLTARKI
jgi:hypothetical protein